MILDNREDDEGRTLSLITRNLGEVSSTSPGISSVRTWIDGVDLRVE